MGLSRSFQIRFVHLPTDRGGWRGGAKCNRLMTSAGELGPLPCQLSPNGDASGVLDLGGARVKMGGKQGGKVGSGVSRYG